MRMAGAEHVAHEFVLLFLLSAKCLIELKAYFSIQISFYLSVLTCVVTFNGGHS